MINLAVILCITMVLMAIASALPLKMMPRRSYNYYNPEENIGSGLYLKEGDILMDRRRGMDNRYYANTWLNRSVPYEFEANFDDERRKQVESAMYDIQNNSCLTFKRRTIESDYIRIIISSSGCNSPVGRRGGAQNISLKYDGCFLHGTIQHEFLHALGLWHEHSRRDRDSYIKVIKENIQQAHRDNFEMQTIYESQKSVLDLPYDYGSVMHYQNNTFSIDRRKPTIVPLNPIPKGVVMGQRERFSQGDMRKLKALYRCDVQNCTEPEPLPLGYMSGKRLDVGSKRWYQCQSGHVLVGANERMCLDVGQWTGDTPACLASTPGRPIHYCNFEDKMSSTCGWTPGFGDSIDTRKWTVHSGSTPSTGTGPPNDHTLGTGKGSYAYIEASKGHLGLKGSLVSPRFDLSSRYRTCLAFFTYMYGKNMGNLTVHLTEEGNSTTNAATDGRVVFSLDGEQGRHWKQIFIVLGEMHKPFYLTIEGSTGKGYLSDIAIDDIVLGDCSLLKPVAISDTFMHRMAMVARKE